MQQTESRTNKLACVSCKKPGTSVERTRSYDKFIIRERECSNCGRVFTTIERPDPLPDAHVQNM